MPAETSEAAAPRGFAWSGAGLPAADETFGDAARLVGDAMTASIRESKMPKTAHHEAAEHHEKAAKSHRMAAEHHEKGDHTAASKHADEAHGHSTKAHASSGAAHGKSKK